MLRSFEVLTPEQAWGRMSRPSHAWTYLDVRCEDEFAEGHALGAVNIAYKRRTALGLVPDPDFITRVECRFSRDAALIVACVRGPRANSAAQALADAGFVHIAAMPVGWEGQADAFGTLLARGWKHSGLPRGSAI